MNTSTSTTMSCCIKIPLGITSSRKQSMTDKETVAAVPVQPSDSALPLLKRSRSVESMKTLHTSSAALTDKDSSASCDDELSKALGAAGRETKGTVWAEAWVYEAASDSLVCRAVWIDPNFHGSATSESGCSCNCPVCPLVNPAHADYYAVEPLSPGVGLAGTLWTSICDSDRQSLQRPVCSQIRMHAPTLADDPHQPWDARLQLLPEAGVGWVTGLPFWNERHQRQHQQPQGIVVYMSAAADKDNNDAASNQAQFLQATAAVACAYNNTKEVESPSKHTVQHTKLVNDSHATTIQESTNKNTVTMEWTATSRKTSWMNTLWDNDNDNDITATPIAALKTRPPDWIHPVYALAGAMVFLIGMSLTANMNLNSLEPEQF
jgi:hypothetical protein